MSGSAQSIATFEEFGAGWTAMWFNDTWLLFEPCAGVGAVRPTELGRSMWCVVTSDNPDGRLRSGVENAADRARLWEVARAYTDTPIESCGGVGSVSDPTRWPAGESGAAVPVVSAGDALELCRTFEQAAVYLFVDDERHLIDRNGELVTVQRYRVHRLVSRRLPIDDNLHGPSCLCPVVRYDGSPFVDWACVHGEVWDSAQIAGLTPQPVRVFYGVHHDGRPVLLRSEPDAPLQYLAVGTSRSDARRHAVSAAQEWGRELEDSCPTPAAQCA